MNGLNLFVRMKFKAAVRNFFVFKIYKIYIISEYTMNPFSSVFGLS